VSVVVPTTTVPLGRTEKKVDPVDDATLNSVFDEPDTPRTLNSTVDEVAPIPRTKPLSISVEVPRAPDEIHLDKYPPAPPVKPPMSPKVDVATHSIPVPLETNTILSAPP
jgi:hypothetical protein